MVVNRLFFPPTPALEVVVVDDGARVPPAGGDGHGRHVSERRLEHVVPHFVRLVAHVEDARHPELPLSVVAPAPHRPVTHDGGGVAQAGGDGDGLEVGAQRHLREEVSDVAVVVATVLSVVQTQLLLQYKTKQYNTIAK